jgi:hypothetical protein
MEYTIDALSNASAGGLANCIAMTLFYPLESARLALQARRPVATPKKKKHAHGAATASYAAKVAAAAKENDDDDDGDDAAPYSTALEYFQHQLRKPGGWRNLYRGLSAGISGVTISTFVYFFWYQLLMRAYLARKAIKSKQLTLTLTPLQSTVIASIAGVVNVFQTLPFWVVQTAMFARRQRALVASPSCKGLAAKAKAAAAPTTTTTMTKKKTATENNKQGDMLSVGRSIVKARGVAGLYSGLVPSLLLVSNPIVQFVCYEQMTSFLKRAANAVRRRRGQPEAPMHRSLGVVEVFLIGALSKALATVVTYPIQVSGFQSRSRLLLAFNRALASANHCVHCPFAIKHWLSVQSRSRLPIIACVVFATKHVSLLIPSVVLYPIHMRSIALASANHFFLPSLLPILTLYVFLPLLRTPTGGEDADASA